MAWSDSLAEKLQRHTVQWLPNLKKPKSWTGSSQSACTALGRAVELTQIKQLDITAAAHLYSHFLPVVKNCLSSDGACKGWAGLTG